MSSSEVEEVEELLAHSGSEYEPSSSGEESDVSSLEPSDTDDQDSANDSGDGTTGNKKRKRTRDPNKRRAKMQRNGGATRDRALPTGSTSTGCIQFKPFNELMRGVTFAMSGFVNPLRGELRSKAIDMGARYKPDWDPTCTHLICAFKNTPKYNQVKGRGKIVKKEWIEECHSSRKHFPWRRYALNWRDSNKNESEDEVHEMILTNGSDVPDTPSDSLISTTTDNLDANPSIQDSFSDETRVTSNISSTNDVCPDTSLNLTEIETVNESSVLGSVEQTEPELVSSTFESNVS